MVDGQMSPLSYCRLLNHIYEALLI